VLGADTNSLKFAKNFSVFAENFSVFAENNKNKVKSKPVELYEFTGKNWCRLEDQKNYALQNDDGAHTHLNVF
jgi:hypothetical protein